MEGEHSFTLLQSLIIMNEKKNKEYWKMHLLEMIAYSVYVVVLNYTLCFEELLRFL